jgi:hypothetical protein
LFYFVRKLSVSLCVFVLPSLVSFCSFLLSRETIHYCCSFFGTFRTTSLCLSHSARREQPAVYIVHEYQLGNDLATLFNHFEHALSFATLFDSFLKLFLQNLLDCIVQSSQSEIAPDHDRAICWLQDLARPKYDRRYK